MYKNLLFSNLLIIFLFYDYANLQSTAPSCDTNGLVIVSSGQIDGTDVNMTAVFEFLPTGTPGEIIANNMYGSVEGGSLNDTILYAVYNGYKNISCSQGNVCSLNLTQPNPMIFILFNITYDHINGVINGLYPIIQINYTNWHPSFPSLTQGCYSLNTSRTSDRTSQVISVTDCYCCDGFNSWHNCHYAPNNTFSFTTTTPNNRINSTITTIYPMTGISDSSTMTVASTPNVPESRQINCTNPTDNLVIEYCNLNNTGNTPGNIAKNVTNSINPANLTGYDVYVISKIMFNLTSRKDLKQDDFTSIAHLTDVILAASQETFENSNNGEFDSTMRILNSVHNLMFNSPTNVSYLNGAQLGLASFDINCTIANGDTLMGDTGSRFLTLGPNSDVEAMISIPTNVICQNRTSRRLFYGIYRNTKLFVGNSTHRTNALWKDSQIKNYQPPKNYNPTSFWSRNQHPFEQNAASSQSNPSNIQTSNPDECTNGFWYGDNKVMTGTLSNNDSSTNNHTNMQQFIELDGVRQRMVTVKYSRKKITKPLHGTMKLTWWTGYLWSEQTCSFQEEGDFWVSGCDHLTDFTLVVDGVQKDPSLCSTPLIVIGYIINIGSIISLILLNLIFLLHRISLFQGTKFSQILYGRQTIDTFTLIYNIVLLIFYITFGIFSNENHTSGNTGCKVVAGINYWLLLCCICMTIFQAWKILKIFAWNTKVEQIMTWLTHKFVIIGITIGFPTLMAFILGLAVNNFYNRKDAFCWIRPDYIVPGVVIPITLLIVNGIFCLAVVILRLFPKLCGLRLIRTNSNTLGKKKAKKEKIIALFFMQCTLGIPWILQYLTLFTPSVTAWHYLFTIVNGSQGIILLFIYLYKRLQQYKVSRSEFSDTSDSDTAVTNTRQQRSSTKETTIFNRIVLRISNSLTGKSTEEST